MFTLYRLLSCNSLTCFFVKDRKRKKKNVSTSSLSFQSNVVYKCFMIFNSLNFFFSFFLFCFFSINSVVDDYQGLIRRSTREMKIQAGYK